MLVHGDAAVDDVAAPVGHDVGDGSAAALVDFTEFADLPGTSFSLKMRRILDMNSALASFAAAFSAGAGVFAQADAVA